MRLARKVVLYGVRGSCRDDVDRVSDRVSRERLYATWGMWGRARVCWGSGLQSRLCCFEAAYGLSKQPSKRSICAHGIGSLDDLQVGIKNWGNSRKYWEFGERVWSVMSGVDRSMRG